MSYARFSPESDVYVFPHVGGGFECCACKMGDLVKTVFTTGYKNHPLFGNVEPCQYCHGEGCEECMMCGSTRLETRSEMIAHLEEHIKNGDKVPAYAIESLKRELEKEGERNEPLFDDGYDGPALVDFNAGTVKKLTDLSDKTDKPI